jgi:mitochondrial fission protein ELM1
VQIQDPGVAPDRFDLVVAPSHDGLSGDNVLVTAGSLHGLTRARLDEAAASQGAGVAHLPRPLVAVLVGGANRAYRFTAADAAALGRRLAALPGGLMVTVSRRTGAEATAALKATLDPSRAVVWEGSGDNPYRGWLGLADAIVVTSDSVNMVTEACATGRPVHVAHLPGGSPKFAAFHALMEGRGHTRRFDGALAPFDPVPLDETERVAEAVRALLRRRGVLD